MADKQSISDKFKITTDIMIKDRLPGAVPHQIGLFFLIEFRVELS